MKSLVTRNFILATCLTLSVVNSYADSNKAFEIATNMEKQESGFDNYQADMQMILIDSNGKEKERLMRVKTREMPGDGDQSIAIFDKPADVKGTAFLSYTHIDKDDDQWLYLPALKRVKRIAVRNKTSPFMGSEFSYEDLASFEVEKYSYTYIKDETLEGTPSFVIERYPKDKYSGYSKHRIWVEKERYITLKIEYYDRKENLLKTLNNSDFNIHLNQFWRAHNMRMQNHVSGKRSILRWHNFKFRQSLSDADFNPNRLKRIR